MSETTSSPTSSTPVGHEMADTGISNKQEEDASEDSSSSDSDSEIDETDEDDSDVSYTSSSSDDSSLGNIIAGIEGGEEALMAGVRCLPRPKRCNSMPTMMTMQLEADVELDNPEHREALERFMDRMNNAADAYFQAPTSERRPPRKTNSTGAIQDIRKNAVDKENPANFFLSMVQDILPETMFPGDFWDQYFLPITEKRRRAYQTNVVEAVRAQNLDQLKAILAAQGDASMEACNAQGETLLHLACRRRNHDLVKFLVITAHVSTRVRDDFGKTPLHEVCWYTEPRNPSQFDSVDFLMVLGPEMFFAKDKRGYTPLQYAPKASWKDWCRFLSRQKESIRAKVSKMKFN